MFRQVVTGIINDTKEVTLFPERIYEVDVIDNIENKINTFTGYFYKYEYSQIILKRKTNDFKYIHQDDIEDIREVK